MKSKKDVKPEEVGPVLAGLQSPADLKDLTLPRLEKLADEIREKIKEVVSDTGGHLATNLGIVELTIALHRTFDFSRDRLVFDVGHQCYCHKILTGRRDTFHTLRTRGGMSGYPNRNESPYDTFNAGHAGTAISAALGLAAGDAITGTDRQVVVVIGDGSIPTGLSFEGLNQLGHLRRNVIIILNDNEMSISPTVGALAHHLTRIRTGSFYNDNRRRFQNIIRKLPLGKKVNELADHISSSLVKAALPGHFFEELGIRYFGPINGHSIPELEKVLANCRKLKGPILVHVITTKGHGYLPAKNDPESYHGASPFHIHDGSSKKAEVEETYSEVFSETLTRLAADDPRIVAITAAMPLGTGLNLFQEKHPDRFFDVGICEQHAVTFAGGLSDAGLKPVVAIYSTFLQRSFDQVFHDVSMQENMNVIFAMDRAGLVGSDGFSHHGLVDIGMMRVFPHITVMAPKDKTEFILMLEYMLQSGGIYAVRYPREMALDGLGGRPCPAIAVGKAEVLRKGQRIAVLAYGAMVGRALEAHALLAADGREVTVVNARFAKPVDTGLLRELSASHAGLLTVEDHAAAGGFGSAVLEACQAEAIHFDAVRILGVPDRFIPHASRQQQLITLGLDGAGIAAAVRAMEATL